MSIYIVTHKPFSRPAEPGYRVIFAGAAAGGHGFGDCFDDAAGTDAAGTDAAGTDVAGTDADVAKGCSDRNGFSRILFPGNISEKNPTFCELTALYWLWRHCRDDYIGLVHYRRYFSNRWCDDAILSEQDACRALRSYDIILPQVAYQKVTMREEFVRRCGTYEDLDLLRKIIEEQCPEYLDTFDAYFFGKKTCFMNMLICRRELLDQYCAWLFPVLFAMEQRVDLSGRSAYQQRLFGFLGERLLNVWVLHHRLKACHVFLIETEKRYGPALDLVYKVARTGTWWLQMHGTDRTAARK